MKPPRLPAPPLCGARRELEPLSIVDIADKSPWSGGLVAGRLTLVSWRTTLALLLREVSIAPVALALWPTLQTMAQQVVERVKADAADSQGRAYSMSYFDWLTLWSEQFDHWHDPVRALVAAHCTSGDAAKVVQQFPHFAGLPFADFVVAAVEAFDEKEAWHASIMGEPQPELSLPLDVHRSRRSTAMERVCHQLFDEFQGQSGVATTNPPFEFSLKNLVADIYGEPRDDAPLPLADEAGQ